MTPAPYILGADPGLDGAVALYDPPNDRLLLFRMPTFTIRVNGKMRRQVDPDGLRDRLELHADSVRLAIVENVHAMPKQGVSSSFRFGHGFGVLQGVLAALRIPRAPDVEPSVWKRALGLSGDKDASRRLASRLLPRHAHHWPLTKDDGAAEAALIAYYGSKVTR